MSSVTEQWAVASICGPRAPELRGGSVRRYRRRSGTLPLHEPRIRPISTVVPARVFRISLYRRDQLRDQCAGKLRALALATLMERGGPYGITPYGTEGMHLLRAEKGFIIVGQRDRRHSDAGRSRHGLGGERRTRISSASARSPAPIRPATNGCNWVGLLSDDPAFVIPEGSQIIVLGAREQSPRTPMIGHVTSSYFSPQSSGARSPSPFVAGGHGRMGERIHIGACRRRARSRHDHWHRFPCRPEGRTHDRRAPIYPRWLIASPSMPAISPISRKTPFAGS